MSTTQKYVAATTWGTLLAGTELNGLANNSLVLGATPYDNTQNAGTVDATHGDGDILCDLEGKFVFGTAPADNTAFSVWFLALLSDGTTYEDGSSSIIPARNFDVTFPFKNANGTTQIINRRVVLPWGTFKALAKNDGTTQALAAGNNSYIKIRPVTFQGI